MAGSGQPSLRRINTFTSPLPAFHETEEYFSGQIKSQHSSEEDLMKQLWGSTGNHTAFHFDDVRAI